MISQPATTTPPYEALARGEAAAAALTVDARMLFHSGIGRYLREVLSRWPEDVTLRETFLYNKPEQRDWLSATRPWASFQRASLAIYSAGEQFLPRKIPTGNLYWIPHYNLPFRSRVPLVATVHDAAPLVLREAFPSIVQRLAARFYFAAVRRTTRRVITVSHFTAHELTRRVGVPASKIDVIANGVDASWYPAAASTRRDPHRFLFVGNLKSHKNLTRLLDALERLRTESGLKLTLDVVGQTHGFRAGLETDTAARLALTPWVRLHGKVDDAQLRELYATAGALVFPSLYEGFGLPMLESMASGCPVISSSAGALPEVGGPDQDQGGCVIYFNPRDPIDIARGIGSFLRLPEAEHMRMSEKGRLRATSYTWDEAARQTRDILLREAVRIQPK